MAKRKSRKSSKPRQQQAAKPAPQPDDEGLENLEEVPEEYRDAYEGFLEYETDPKSFEEADDEDDFIPEEAVSAYGIQPMETAAQRRKRRQRLTQAQDNNGKQDARYIAQLLANPVKTVTEDELRAEYAFVLTDLRSMGLLAVGLVVLLVVLALLLV